MHVRAAGHAVIFFSSQILSQGVNVLGLFGESNCDPGTVAHVFSTKSIVVMASSSSSGLRPAFHESD